MSTEDHFFSKVREEGECWLWTGAVSGSGYGAFWVAGRMMLPHRFSYQYLIGEIPPGLHLDHLCRVRTCVNPWHLEPVTPRVNSLRGVGPCAVNASQMNCPSGHPYDATNTYHRPSGGRGCRLCRRDAWRRYDAKRRGAAA